MTVHAFLFEKLPYSMYLLFLTKRGSTKRQTENGGSIQTRRVNQEIG